MTIWYQAQISHSNYIKVVEMSSSQLSSLEISLIENKILDLGRITRFWESKIKNFFHDLENSLRPGAFANQVSENIVALSLKKFQAGLA